LISSGCPVHNLRIRDKCPFGATCETHVELFQDSQAYQGSLCSQLITFKLDDLTDSLRILACQSS
jgi:hypothetical protein